MTAEEVRGRLNALGKRTRAVECDLFEVVLQAIADGSCADAQTCAREVLKVKTRARVQKEPSATLMVRVPKTLLDKFRGVAKKHHYRNISVLIRALMEHACNGNLPPRD